MFDEAQWSLSVDGAAVPLESKPLTLLHALLIRAGEVVTKEELLDIVWPGVSVVEASLPTAIAKLRRALGDDRSATPIILTVPRIGYRLAAPVTLDEGEAVAASAPPSVAVPSSRGYRLTATSLLLVAALGAAVAGVGHAWTSRPLPARSPEDLQRAGIDAVRRMDLPAIEQLIHAGWKPATSVNDQDNDALKMLLERCEWDPGHDRQKLLVIARTLIDGGIEIQHRNVWGDTSYSIAKAPRYCGPDHPVTKMLRALCYSGGSSLQAQCEADYAHSRWRQRPIQVN